MSADTITDLRRRFNFFLDNAGGWVGHNAESAIALARAERYAEQQGWTWKWVDDDDMRPDPGNCDCGGPTCVMKTGPWYGCILIDEEGEDVGPSLWSITFARGKDYASDPYGRVVQAELALEALHDIERRWQDDKDAERYMAL